MSYAAPDSQLRRVTRHSTRDSTARSIHRQLSVIPGTRPIKRWNYSQDPDNLWKRLRYWGYPTYGAYEGIEALDHFRPGGYHPIHLQDELDNGRYRVIHKLYIHWDAAVSWLCRDQHAEIPRYVDVHILTADESGAEEIATAKKIRDMCKDEPDLHRRLRLPPRDFTSHSANGTHICLVYPVLGPQVEQAADIFGGHYVDSVETDSEGSVDSGLDCMDRDISDLNDTEAAHGHAESWDSDDFMSDSDLEDPVNELEREMFNSRMLRGLCRDTVEAVTMLHKRGLCHRGSCAING